MSRDRQLSTLAAMRASRSPVRRTPARRLVGALDRSLRDGLVRNSGWIMATTAANAALGYVYWIVAARLLTHSALGLATSLIALMNVATLVFAVGLGPALIATLPGLRSGRAWAQTLNAALVMAAGVAAITGVAVVLVLPALSASFAPLADDPALQATFVGASVVWTVGTILDYAYVAERQASLMFTRNVVFAIGKIPLLPLALLGVTSSTLALLGSWAVAAALSCVLGLLVLASRLGRGYGLWIGGTRAAAGALSTHLVGHHLASVGAQLPIFLLPALVAARLGTAENAYFYVAWAAAGVFFLISPAVAASLFAEAVKDRAGLRSAVVRSAGTIGALLAPAMLVFLLFGEEVMSLFGPTYPAHTLPLLLPLVLSGIPDAVTNLYITVLRVRARLRAAAALNVGIGTATLALAWVLLPEMGIAGAGWAWLIAQSAGAVVASVDAVIESRLGRRRARRERAR